jgi:hypothetical protein
MYMELTAEGMPVIVNSKLIAQLLCHHSGGSKIVFTEGLPCLIVDEPYHEVAEMIASIHGVTVSQSDPLQNQYS